MCGVILDASYFIQDFFRNDYNKIWLFCMCINFFLILGSGDHRFCGVNRVKCASLSAICSPTRHFHQYLAAATSTSIRGANHRFNLKRIKITHAQTIFPSLKIAVGNVAIVSLQRLYDTIYNFKTFRDFIIKA